MTTLRDAWREAWSGLPDLIRSGPLSAKDRTAPSTYTVKWLLPTLFAGVLDARQYAPGAPRNEQSDPTLHLDRFVETVRSREADLLALHDLVSRLRAIYARHRRDRVSLNDPGDFWMKHARTLWQKGIRDPEDPRVEQQILDHWPLVDATWVTDAANSTSARKALAKPEVREELAVYVTQAWATRPVQDRSPGELGPACHDVTVRWRARQHGAHLDQHWDRLRSLIDDRSLDAWVVRQGLAADPVRPPEVTGNDRGRPLDRPINKRLRPLFTRASRDGLQLPELGVVLVDEARRAAAPLGLADLNSRAAFLCAYSVMVHLPSARSVANLDENHPGWLAEPDQHGGEGAPLRLTLLAIALRYAIGRRTTVAQVINAIVAAEDGMFLANEDSLRQADWDSDLVDPHLGPANRLWARIAGLEMVGTPVAGADPAYSLARIVFQAWAKDRLSRKLTATPAAPDPPPFQGSPEQEDAAIGAVICANREHRDALLEHARTARSASHQTAEFSDLWGRMSANTPRRDLPEGAPTWEAALDFILFHFSRGHR